MPWVCNEYSVWGVSRPPGLSCLDFVEPCDALVIPFVKEVIEAGSEVHTDGLAAYRTLEALGYRHQRIVMQESEHLRMSRCLGYIASPRSSSGGFWERITAQSNPANLTLITTNLSFGSTAGLPLPEACSSTACSNRPLSPTR